MKLTSIVAGDMIRIFKRAGVVGGWHAPMSNDRAVHHREGLTMIEIAGQSFTFVELASARSRGELVVWRDDVQVFPVQGLLMEGVS